MNKNVGGRGKKSPYESTHVRVPLPIKDRVEYLKQLYIDGALEHYDQLLKDDHEKARSYENLLTGSKDKVNPSQNLLTGSNEKLDFSQNPLPSLNDALAQAKSLLKQKKSAKDTIAKLLTALYGQVVTVDDLNIKPVDNTKIPIIWQVGDKCDVLMPSGVTIYDGEVVSIDHKRGCCKVLVKDTDSHFSAELSNLSKPK